MRESGKLAATGLCINPGTSPPTARRRPFGVRTCLPFLAHFKRTITARAGLVAAGCIVVVAACVPAIGAFGDGGQAPVEKASDFFSALSVRFGVAYRDARFEAIRPRMVRHALTPSRIYSDTTIWTSTTGEVRTVSVGGALAGDRYILAARPVVAPPAVPGDSRHLMHLRRIGPDIHRWDSTDELAVGTVAPSQVIDLLEGLIRGAERPATEIQAEYRSEFPRTTATLGRLFALDTLRTTTDSTGATAITLVARLESKRMRPYAPHYADYIDEYLEPLRIDVTLTDRQGRSWGRVAFRKNLFELRVRARDGKLVSLDGAGMSVPDSLRLRAAFFAKVLFFDVGASNIHADVIPVRTDDARGWSLQFRQEPRWHFPLAVSRLVRGPLRRPFADDGIRLEFIARRTGTGQTVLARNIGITVQESAIVRWLGGLGATAMGDLSILAEQEKDRYVGDVFRALADDSRGLLSR